MASKVVSALEGLGFKAALLRLGFAIDAAGARPKAVRQMMW